MTTPARSKTIRPVPLAKLFWIIPFLIALIAFGIYLLRFEFRSAAFLIQFLDPKAKGLLVRLERHEFDTQELTLFTSQGQVRAK